MSNERLTPQLLQVIERVEGDLKTTRQELTDKCSFHQAAWQEYGSELCAGGMMAEEREIEKKIRALESDLSLLYRYGDDLLDKTLSAEDARRLAEIDAAAAALAEERKQIIKRLGESDRLAALLGQPR